MRTVWLAVLGACGFNPHGAVGDGPTGDAIVDGQSDAEMGSGSNPGGARRKPITIAAANAGGSLADFPVWIDLNDPDIAARAQSSGADIFFTDANGSALDRELVSWSSPTHQLRAWVRVPTLDTTGTTIYVEYGDASKAPPVNPSGVFKSSFSAVWHLDDATTITDSCSKIIATGVNLAPAVTGELGSGIYFDGTGASMITFANPFSGGTAATISAWVQQQPTTHTSTVLLVGSNSTDESRFLYGYAGNGSGSNVAIGQYGDDWNPSNADIESAAAWTYLVWTSEGANKKNHVFVNGVEIGGSPVMLKSAASTAGDAGYIGFAPSPQYGSANGMFGTLDEVRIATTQRTQSWITAEYANQSSPSTFYSVGAEQIAP